MLSLSVESRIGIAISVLGWLFNLILTIFRISTFEIEYKLTGKYGLQSSVIEFLAFSVLLAVTIYAENLNDAIWRKPTILITVLLNTKLFQLVRLKYVKGQAYATTDLTEKVFIVTGCNTGIGFETAKALIKMNSTVIMACRSTEKANQAKTSIINDLKCAPSKLIVIKLDLCGFDSVRKFVKDFRLLNLPLHGLVNNAGLMISNRTITQDGFEMVITANHLSHFLLTNLLLPDLEKTGLAEKEKAKPFAPRIVVLSSALHHLCKKINFDDIMSERGYEIFSTYGQSKLANILFTKELQRRLTNKGSTVSCHSVHPGCVRTEFTRHMNPILQFLNKMVEPLLGLMQKSPPQGAYSSIHVATCPVKSLEPYGGHYFHCTPAVVSASALVEKEGEKLWMISENLTGLKSR